MNYYQSKQNNLQNLEQPDIQTNTVNGILYFTIDRGLNSKQCWKTDGTSKGTICITAD